MHSRAVRTSPGTTRVVFLETRPLIGALLHEVIVAASCLIDIRQLVELQCVLRRRARRQHLGRFCELGDVTHALYHIGCLDESDDAHHLTAAGHPGRHRLLWDGRLEYIESRCLPGGGNAKAPRFVKTR
jgi:hypothetical protein